MIKTGIWIDKDKALIVTLKNGEAVLCTLYSSIEHFHVHGGSGTRLKGGPQDVVQDSKYLRREKHQLKQFFKKIASKIRGTNALVIFGPSDTNEKFSDELHANYKSLSAHIKGVKKVDSMTNNQLKALVRDFFSED
jgi:stalled ribosome rescue protein Dom34